MIIFPPDAGQLSYFLQTFFLNMEANWFFYNKSQIINFSLRLNMEENTNFYPRLFQYDQWPRLDRKIAYLFLNLLNQVTAI